MSKIYEKEVFAEIAETFDEVDRRVLLWTNPNPNATFASQTIALDLSAYDAIDVVFQHWANNPCSTVWRAEKESVEYLASGISNTPASSGLYRRAFCMKEDGVYFANGLSAGSVDNNSTIPRKIYGIQFGASAGDGSSGGTMNYPDLLHKPTINGVTLVEGLVTEDLNLGDTAHEEVTKAEFDALTDEKKNDGTVYFITDGLSGNVFLDDNVPVGTIAPFGGTTDPSYWLICDGRAVSRTDYASLFSVIGTTYGVGDGSTTFNIPDLRGRTAQGAGTLGDETYTLGDSVDAGLPNITGGAVTAHAANTCFFNVVADSTGAFYSDNTVPNNGQPSLVGTFSGHNKLMLDASRSSSVYGNSSTVQPNAVITNYIIKYASTVSEHQANIDFYYPVGSYYETSNASFDPNVTWGGTWVSEGAVDDYIVEEGTDGIWTYRKWNSGVAECCGTYSATLTYYATSGSFYGFTTHVDFPQNLFSERPVAVYNCLIDSAFSMAAANLGLTKDGMNLYALSNAGATQPTVWDIQVNGRWKELDINTKFKWHRTA